MTGKPALDTPHDSLVVVGVSQERVNAARRRIASVQRELERWETVGMQSTCGTFSMQIAMLKDALDLLDEKVKLA